MLLQQHLEAVDFDPKRDRLFSLGDLIDRGPESEKTLDYLQQPWFHAILGNHEIMLIEAYESNEPQSKARWHYWGGDWAASLDQPTLDLFYETLVELPIAIELQVSQNKAVGLVHAELPAVAHWQDIRSRLSSCPAGVFDTRDPTISDLYWAKTQVGGDATLGPVDGINHVFHGHSIVHVQPLTLGNRTFMDLGSYETGEIGFIHVEHFLQACD